MVVYSTVFYGTILHFMVLYCTVQYNIYSLKTDRTTSKPPPTNSGRGRIGTKYSSQIELDS